MNGSQKNIKMIVGHDWQFSVDQPLKVLVMYSFEIYLTKNFIARILLTMYLLQLRRHTLPSYLRYQQLHIITLTKYIIGPDKLNNSARYHLQSINHKMDSSKANFINES